MENVRVQKGNTVKVIPAEYKKDYINAGWGEVKQPTTKGVSSPRNEYNKD